MGILSQSDSGVQTATTLQIIDGGRPDTATATISVYIAPTPTDTLGKVAFNVFLMATRTPMFLETFADPFVAADTARKTNTRVRIALWDVDGIPPTLDLGDWKAVARAKCGYQKRASLDANYTYAYKHRESTCEAFRAMLRRVGVPANTAQVVGQVVSIEVAMTENGVDAWNHGKPRLTIDGVTFQYDPTQEPEYQLSIVRPGDRRYFVWTAEDLGDALAERETIAEAAEAETEVAK